PGVTRLGAAATDAKHIHLLEYCGGYEARPKLDLWSTRFAEVPYGDDWERRKEYRYILKY
ncbi:hypothetical protein, partial [Leptospira ellisii]